MHRPVVSGAELLAASEFNAGHGFLPISRLYRRHFEHTTANMRYLSGI